jgi:N-acetylmuramoyl-L-alanine amidase
MRILVGLGLVLVVGVFAVAIAIRSHDSDSSAGPTSNSTEPQQSPTSTTSGSNATNLDLQRCIPGESVENGPLQGRTIIIDPGHGGEDLGTVNNDFGLTESELVLPISERLAALIVSDGGNACLTRVDDSYIGLGARAEFANEQSGDAFISIHLNSLPNPEENYVMALWGNEAKDRYLAEKIIEPLRHEMATPSYRNGQPNPMNPDVYLLRGLDSNMLRNARMPAVIVEASFLSNTWEAQAFLDGIANGTHWRERQIAWAVHSGIVDYFDAFQ